MFPNLKFVFLSLIVVFVRADEDITVITTADGPIKGRVMLSSNGRVFIGFLAIPYAIPPVKELRFKPPQPVEPWKDVLIARNEGHICMQYLIGTEVIAGEEDCLTLNVFTHRLHTKVPILVWIHEGLFYSGSAGVNNIHGPHIIMDNNIVYVTINYRLGPMGFMSTGDPHLPGNYGLKDQVLALKWIKRNAESFGGDPTTITVYGTGVGGACAHYHMFSPLSSGLFSRLIYQSGSALNYWAFKRNPLETTRKIAEHVHCTTTTTKEMVTCLKATPAKDLIQTLYIFPHFDLKKPVPYGPVQEFQSMDSNDPPFLSDSPEKLLKSGYFNDVPVITGHNKDDALGYAKLVYNDKYKMQEFKENFEDVIRTCLHLNFLKSSTIQKIREFYFGDLQVVNVTLHKMVEMFTDALVIHGTIRAANLQAKSGVMPVYYYVRQLSEDSEENEEEDDERLQKLQGRVNRLLGLSQILPDPMIKENELEIVNRMWQLLSSFCAVGNPTPGKPKLIPIQWKPLKRTGTKFQYLHIGKNLEMRYLPEYMIYRMEFWESIYYETEDTERN